VKRGVSKGETRRSRTAQAEYRAYIFPKIKRETALGFGFLHIDILPFVVLK
jgi:hypothetical protein